MNIEDWTKKIDWNKRIKAVCKPCWEIKYCPYGSLTEYMPLKDDDVKKICRIFGHVCPVYITAEPFTETKELRTISRNIPREVQLRVSRRDNNVCQLCSSHVLDKDIHFDHIIPWGKGGSSDENNIRILCKKCNLKRSDNFESELLVTNFNELSSGLINITQKMLYDIMISVVIMNKIKDKTEEHITTEFILNILTLSSEQRENAEIVYTLVFELDDLITKYMNDNFSKTDIKKLKYRFGYNAKKQVHSILETANMFKVSANNIKKVENTFLNYIGLNIHYLDEHHAIQYDNKMIKEINKTVE